MDPLHDVTAKDPRGPLMITSDGLALEVVEGPSAGARAVLTERSLDIGSAADNDLVLAHDKMVSRHHARVELADGGVWVVDVGSTNGTVLDGVQVARARLVPGQRLVLGETTIAVSATDTPLVIALSDRDRFHALIGGSVAMRELYPKLERAAASAASVLLHGETGTGKELAAEAIHEASPRAAGPFVVVDCGAIPPTLFESELFGHVRGAFTGANTDRTGLFVEADGGTIFLDEIGELPLELQPKLLRVLERGEARPVGATRPVEVSVRVVAATHRDLAQEVKAGRFREDLFYRLAVIRLTLPALRERRDDIPALVERFVGRIAPDRVADAPRIAQLLLHRSFPGNVRQLRNAVEEMLVLGIPGEAPPPPPDDGSITPEHVYELPYKEASDLMSARFQRDYVERLLDETDGNVSEAARRAGMSRRYLQTVIARLGIR